ncbi:hypothetical protein BMON_0911 [Bifidobacterium mongoliense DSM 21395]|uniref:Uncharacterized protein n=1 Tax=Bifidobacterium mongoliense DSM 21395 TaxID=1437603 RepID=A0A087BWT8_9BIFI|nr:hypothetical protein BMON_0911 [Bifidobacterium mongoliense DSM 21395]
MLIGELACAMVEGYQGSGLNDPTSILQPPNTLQRTLRPKADEMPPKPTSLTAKCVHGSFPHSKKWHVLAAEPLCLDIKPPTAFPLP